MAEVTTIQIFGSTDADNIANIEMPDEGLILGVQMIGLIDNASGDGDLFLYELSFGAVSSFATNDARSVIAIAAWKGSLSGVAASYATSIAEAYIDLRPGIKVFGGERIYMHGLAGAGGLNTSCRALLICQFQKFTSRRR